MYTKHMAQYNVKVQVGDRVRVKSTGHVCRVVSVEPSPVGELPGPEGLRMHAQLYDVTLHREGDGEPVYVGALEGCLLDHYWEKVL